jgi:16S rRNA C967 or C1407 C5-methylase (RsmB/RsmF family)
VLRTLSRTRDHLGLPPRPGPDAARESMLAYLGVTQSHPDWLAARWLDRYGFEPVAAWTEFNNTTPPLTLRANRLVSPRDDLRRELAAEAVETVATTYAPDGLLVQSGRLPPARGRFTVQDESSQLVPLLLEARPGDTVLDLCASPGGKATALAAEMQGRGLVVACDARARRMRLLAQTVRDSGAPNIRLVQVGAREEAPFRPVFSRVLVDAPCSGLGTVRRDPDIRWRRSESQLRVAANQRVLPTAPLGQWHPAGVVCATCSSEPEENEAGGGFLAEHPGSGSSRRRLAAVADARGMLRTLPFITGWRRSSPRRPRPAGLKPPLRTQGSRGAGFSRHVVARSAAARHPRLETRAILLLAGALGLTFWSSSASRCAALKARQVSAGARGLHGARATTAPTNSAWAPRGRRARPTARARRAHRNRAGKRRPARQRRAGWVSSGPRATVVRSRADRTHPYPPRAGRPQGGVDLGVPLHGLSSRHRDRTGSTGGDAGARRFALINRAEEGAACVMTSSGSRRPLPPTRA